jgi:dephospho-CoA kinase
VTGELRHRARHRAARIGITGPIGCGKSTIARWLGERNDVVVVDADRVARDVLDPGEPALDAVIARFGGEFLRETGELDRAALGRVVFADPAALRDLEDIVHPAVRPRILATIAEADASGASAVIVEAIKLVEGGLASVCDEVWLVTCEPDAQRARLVERGMPDGDAVARIAAQSEMVERLSPAASRIIDASGSIEATRESVDEALDEIVKCAPNV